MRRESIIVVYDSCQAIAEDVADRLGAETVCVQDLSHRNIDNADSLVLAPEFQADGTLTPHWQYGLQALQQACLTGKAIAVMVALGDRHDHGAAVAGFTAALKDGGAHVVGRVAYVGAPGWDVDLWTGAVSPSL